MSLDGDIQYLRQLLTSVRHSVVHNPLSLAAVLASQRVDDAASATSKDSVRVVVEHARNWMNQVNTQALVPVPYTADKTSRLLHKANTLFGVKSLLPVPGTMSLLVQRNKSVLLHSMMTLEDIPLATLTYEVISVHLSSDDFVCVLCKEGSKYFRLEVFSLEKGKHLKSVPLGEGPLAWIDIRTPYGSFYANKSEIFDLDFEKGIVTTITAVKQNIKETLISHGKTPNLVTLTVTGKTAIDCAPVTKLHKSQACTVKPSPPNKHCRALMATKDGKWVILVTERQAIQIDVPDFIPHQHQPYGLNGLPIVKADLSRSHEHLFLVYANSSITCHVLRTHAQAMCTRLRPKPLPRVASSIAARDGIDTNDEPQQADMVISLLTSEDDHFLICGTNFGLVYIVHVPTGQQVVAITTGQMSIINLTFLTDSAHFQHLITTDSEGTSLHWNLRPVFTLV